MTTAIRDLHGRFVSKKAARLIASQVTTLPIEEPRVPTFIERGKHPHSTCSCWREQDMPTLWESVSQWIRRGRER